MNVSFDGLDGGCSETEDGGGGGGGGAGLIMIRSASCISEGRIIPAIPDCLAESNGCEAL